MSHVGDEAARRIITRPGEPRIIVLDSATFVDGFYRGSPPAQGDVLVTASYAGVFCAKLCVPFRPRAVIGLDCMIGKDGAGVAALWYYEALGIPGAATDVNTAEMGNGIDMYEAGIISRVNAPAEDSGVKPGMRVADAAAIIARPAPPPPGVRTNRLVVKTNTVGRSIVCTDSIAYALPEDRDRNVLCVGGHTGASVIGYLCDEFRPFGYLCSDGGIGKNRSGLAALEATDKAGVAGASVSAHTARMGDGRSTYFDGEISAMNERARAKGVRVGQKAAEAAEYLLKE